MNTVLEIDPGLVRLARDRLGLITGPDLDVRIGDARILLQSVGRRGYDVVLGDAFGGLAVPWHLTTEEFLSGVRASLDDGGVYLMNLIDYPPMRFARAQVATLARVFDDVAVIAPPDLLDGRRGGNVVLVASVGPLDTERIAAEVAGRQGTEVVLSGTAVEEFTGGAAPLVDDLAPVDQWLSRARRG
jgi:spermidine synthase